MPHYEADLPVSVFKEGNTFVASTPALDLSTCGQTIEEAEKRFEEAVALFFEELARMGTTDDVLQELGWTKDGASWRPPTEVSHSMETVLLPA